ncbi:hypothetical protein [Neisseria meningitidis]|uniref:hypothetical protein n=1 Tax=Neisseria meningitidis TaxID=487 RepID=UPI001865313E|nr:hypothetical protein [Neisseria meningitidis]
MMTQPVRENHQKTVIPDPGLKTAKYSGLNSNQYGVTSPCRTICTVYGFVALS